MLIQWKNRVEAGRALAEQLTKYDGQSVVVYGLPRGGVVTAAEVADKLGAKLDLLITRKIGHPHHPEYAIGALTETGKPILNEAETTVLDRAWLDKEVAKQRAEAKRRSGLFLGKNGRLSAKNKIAIIVDDGIATGLTILAGIQELKAEKPTKIILAVPVAPEDTIMQLQNEVDEVVCLEVEDDYFSSVGSYYNHFNQVEDAEVISILQAHKSD